MLRSFLAGALVVVVFFLLLEGGLRLSGLVPTQALRSPDVETLDRIPGLFEPGQEFVDRIRPDLPYPVRINALGFRGRDFPETKAPGTWRVLCLGDSYTFGHHVKDDEAFPAVLDRALGRSGHAEAINGGANGFTVVDEARFLAAKAMRLQPDAIVLVFSQNDISDLARPQPMIDSMRAHAQLKSRPVVGSLLKGLQRTAIFNGMQRLAAWMRVRRLRAAVGSPRGESEVAALRDRYIAGLADVAAAAKGVPVLLVGWPSAEQVTAGTVPPVHAELSRGAQQNGFAFLDLSEAMAEVLRTGGAPYLVPLDGHPSAAGHRAAAAAIERRLAELGWLPADVAAAATGEHP